MLGHSSVDMLSAYYNQLHEMTRLSAPLKGKDKKQLIDTVSKYLVDNANNDMINTDIRYLQLHKFIGLYYAYYLEDQINAIAFFKKYLDKSNAALAHLDKVKTIRNVNSDANTGKAERVNIHTFNYCLADAHLQLANAELLKPNYAENHHIDEAINHFRSLVNSYESEKHDIDPESSPSFKQAKVGFAMAKRDKVAVLMRQLAEAKKNNNHEMTTALQQTIQTELDVALLMLIASNERALELAELYVQKGKSLLQDNKPKEALIQLQLAKSAIKSESQTPGPHPLRHIINVWIADAYRIQAELSQNANEKTAALESADRIIQNTYTKQSALLSKSHPQCAYTLQKMGDINVAKQDIVAAVDCYIKAIKIFQKDSGHQEYVELLRQQIEKIASDIINSGTYDWQNYRTAHSFGLHLKNSEAILLKIASINDILSPDTQLLVAEHFKQIGDYYVYINKKYEEAINCYYTPAINQLSGNHLYELYSQMAYAYLKLAHQASKNFHLTIRDRYHEMIENTLDYIQQYVNDNPDTTTPIAIFRLQIQAEKALQCDDIQAALDCYKLANELGDKSAPNEQHASLKVNYADLLRRYYDVILATVDVVHYRHHHDGYYLYRTQYQSLVNDVDSRIHTNTVADLLKSHPYPTKLFNDADEYWRHHPDNNNPQWLKFIHAFNDFNRHQINVDGLIQHVTIPQTPIAEIVPTQQPTETSHLENAVNINLNTNALATAFANEQPTSSHKVIETSKKETKQKKHLYLGLFNRKKDKKQSDKVQHIYTIRPTNTGSAE